MNNKFVGVEYSNPYEMCDGYWGGFGKEGIWIIDDKFPNTVFLRRKNLETGYWEYVAQFQDSEWKDLTEEQKHSLPKILFQTKEQEFINVQEYYSREHIINSFEEIQPKVKIIHWFIKVPNCFKLKVGHMPVDCDDINTIKLVILKENDEFFSHWANSSYQLIKFLKNHYNLS